jgi:hypothetical protein
MQNTQRRHRNGLVVVLEARSYPRIERWKLTTNMYRGQYDKQLNWPDRMRFRRIPRIHVRMRHVWRYGDNPTPGIMMTCKKAETSCKSWNSITEFRLYSHSALELRRGYMTKIWRICTVWQEVIWLYEHEISANITDSYIRMSLRTDYIVMICN